MIQLVLEAPVVPPFICNWRSVQPKPRLCDALSEVPRWILQYTSAFQEVPHALVRLLPPVSAQLSEEREVRLAIRVNAKLEEHRVPTAETYIRRSIVFNVFPLSEVLLLKPGMLHHVIVY